MISGDVAQWESTALARRGLSVQIRSSPPFHVATVLPCTLTTANIHEAVMRLRYKGHTVDALELMADEGRGKLRKAAGRSKHPLIRRSPNGATLLVEDQESRKGGNPVK